MKPGSESAEETLRIALVNIQFSADYELRLASGAQERQMSVEEFVVDAIERALRPIENRRRIAARDILELEALWGIEDSIESGGKDEPRA